MNSTGGGCVNSSYLMKEKRNKTIFVYKRKRQNVNNYKEQKCTYWLKHGISYNVERSRKPHQKKKVSKSTTEKKSITTFIQRQQSDIQCDML